ncbi:MAG TPA: ATP-binding protein, partial [Firmicutes bacterium]|nr:ATP-binding protein [Bacillota bacterium]
SGWADELAALDARLAGDEYGEEFLIAILAVAAARHIFPNSAQPDGGARFARLLSHRAGYSPDITESAVALARYCHVPAEDNPVISKLLVASLIVDMRCVARTAEVFGVDTARFRQRCCALDCWDGPFEPSGIPEEASPHVRRRVVEAVVERVVPVDEVEAYARSLASDTIGHMIVTVGIPGAGKTTWVERVLGSVPIVSTDRLRGVLLGDATDQSRNDMIISRSIAAAESIAASGRTVVFDATNTNHRGRERIRRALRRSGARSTMVYFDTSLDEALRRNMIRPRAVPDEVIRKFYRRLEAPRPDEADTTVIVSNVWDQPRIRRYGCELRIRDAIPVEDVGAYLR